jgi:hypothetical protein
MSLQRTWTKSRPEVIAVRYRLTQRLLPLAALLLLLPACSDDVAAPDPLATGTASFVDNGGSVSLDVTAGAIDESDPVRPRLEWTVSTPAPVGDALQIRISWAVDSSRYNWDIHLPPGTRSFRLPEIPAVLAVSPLGATSRAIYIDIDFHDDSFIDGFEQYKDNLPAKSPYFLETEQAGHLILSSDRIILRDD